MQQKWITKLLGYDLVVEFKRGKENVVADALSRQREEIEVTLSVISLPSWDWINEIKELYGEGLKLQELWHKHRAGELNSPYTVKNGMMLYKNRLFILANQGFIQKLLELIHSSPMGGHMGFDKTLHRLKRDFY